MQHELAQQRAHSATSTAAPHHTHFVSCMYVCARAPSPCAHSLHTLYTGCTDTFKYTHSCGHICMLLTSRTHKHKCTWVSTTTFSCYTHCLSAFFPLAHSVFYTFKHTHLDTAACPNSHRHICKHMFSLSLSLTQRCKYVDTLVCI